MTKHKHKNSLTILKKITPTQQVFLALGLFIITALLTRASTMSGIEESIFRAIYGLPSFLYLPFLAITQLGSFYILGAIIAACLITDRYSKALRLTLVGITAYLIAGFCKDLWGRARPNEMLEGLVTLDLARGPGFPSGHMALAVAIALTIGHFLPKKYHWLIAVWIIAVGISRIYLGVHAPLDVIGGFAIGWFSYALFRLVRVSTVRRGKQKPKLKPLDYSNNKIR